MGIASEAACEARAITLDAIRLEQVKDMARWLLILRFDGRAETFRVELPPGRKPPTVGEFLRPVVLSADTPDGFRWFCERYAVDPFADDAKARWKRWLKTRRRVVRVLRNEYLPLADLARCEKC